MCQGVVNKLVSYMCLAQYTTSVPVPFFLFLQIVNPIDYSCIHSFHGFLTLTLTLTHLLSLHHCIFINTSQHSQWRLLSLSVERHSTDVLVLPNGVFAARFYAVGYNAFALVVWFAKLSSPSATVVWMANRDQHVNGKGSKLSLQKHGNLVLSYTDRTALWTTGTTSVTSVELSLHNTGK
ncbi:hypothetical protein Acr_26g0002580 [Actinidia rufa]|uniref:Bulb-type lectin domain-containing protein n=1 Tax=Actinidia rufa TaxID=165716 RepID=A0A7J0H1V3_9ERIC|nr:hypothetical protein Acr_26g0002580 [Actinidia rufa]